VKTYELFIALLKIFAFNASLQKISQRIFVMPVPELELTPSRQYLLYPNSGEIKKIE